MSAKHEATKRLFLALWPSKGEQERFYALAHQHRPTDKCRLVAAHKLHVTLSFLGAVDSETEDCIRRMADKVAWNPFELHFDRLGWFARPKVLWAGCSSVPVELDELVGRIQTGLAGCGFEPEQRRYQPHVTIARKVARSPAANEVEMIACYFDCFSLFESRMDQRGV
jgi:2'-5' RNA ligase